jgi:hypothetical protein
MFTPDHSSEGAPGKKGLPGGPSTGEPLGQLRRILKFTWIILLAAFIYLGYVFYSRRQENHEFEQKQAAMRTEQQHADDEKTLEQLGGNRFEILNFYASPGSVHPGEKVEVCYGVSNAKSVQLEPRSEPVWPSLSRCVKFTPRKTTIYTLTAQDSAGNKKTATVEVKVR